MEDKADLDQTKDNITNMAVTRIAAAEDVAISRTIGLEINSKLAKPITE